MTTEILYICRPFNKCRMLTEKYLELAPNITAQHIAASYLCLGFKLMSGDQLS
jgi:hypothetical protein